MKPYIIFACIVSTLLSFGQISRSGKPTDSLMHITEATTYLAGQIKEDLSSYSFKPLKLVATLSDSIPDFSKLVSGAEAITLREQLKNFHATFAFRCTTYVYEYTDAYNSFVETCYDIETRLHTPYGTPWNLSFRRTNDYSRVRNVYVISYNALVKRKDSGLSIDHVPFTFFGFGLNDVRTANYYSIEVKGTVPSTLKFSVPTISSKKDSLTAILSDFDKADGDRVRVGNTTYSLDSFPRVRFADTLSIYIDSLGRMPGVGIRVYILETKEVRELPIKYAKGELSLFIPRKK